MPTKCAPRCSRSMLESAVKPRLSTRAGFFVLACYVILTAQILEALVISKAVASVDDIPPAPVLWIQASDVPEDAGGQILVSWALSPDDRVIFSSLVRGGNAAPTSPGDIFRQRGISGYRIYRYQKDEPSRLIAVVAAGIDHYIDAGVEDNALFFYEVRAFDTVRETPSTVEPGSPADAARSARAVTDGLKPLDADGQSVIGWFEPTDDAVDFNDFFLFADHFGMLEGESGFDALFDLNGDHRIDFADFFLFADHFGQVVANYESIVGDSSSSLGQRP